MSRVIASNLEVIRSCPYCEDGRGTINLVPLSLEGARITKPDGLLFTSPEFSRHPIVVFGDDGSAIEPCNHLVVIHGGCWCRWEDGNHTLLGEWEALTDWWSPFFDELDPKDITGDLQDDVFDRRCPEQLQPAVPYESEWFDDIYWDADPWPGSVEGYWQCHGRVVFAADPRLFVVQLVESSDSDIRHLVLQHILRWDRTTSHCGK